MELRRQGIINSSPHLVSLSDSGILSFDTDMKSKVKECTVHFSPVQASGTPAPDNVLPISGWTGVNVGHAGSNEYDPSDNTADKYIDQSGAEITNTYWDLTDYLDVSNCRIVYYKGITQTENAPYSAWYNSQKQFISTFKQQTGVNVVDVPSGAAYVRFSLYHYQTTDDRNTFEFYSGTTYPVDWTDTAGTVYGGYVDLVTGELTATWLGKKISNFTWSYSTYNSANAFRTDDSLDLLGSSSEQGVICSTFASEPMVVNYASSENKPNHTIYRLYTSVERRIFIKCTEYTNVSDFLATYGNEEIAYKLATPITYQLTPQQLSILKGTNNIWSNANGAIDLSFWAHKEPNGGLPLEYRRVEYIATPNTPGPYIQTSFVPSEDYKIELAFYKLGTVSGDNSFFFGSRVPASGYHSCALQLYSGGNFYGACWSASYSRVLSATYSENIAYRVELTSTSLIVGASTAAPSGSLYNESSLPPLVVLARRRGDIVEYHSMNLGLGYLRFTNNHGVVALNLIPCVRKSDDKPGMYDTITKTFYTNAGTGEFVVPNS